MPKSLKAGLAVLVGVFIGGAVVALVETLAHQLTTGMPVFGIAAVGLGLATLAGSFVALAIAKQGWLPWLIGALLGLLALLNVLSFPHPIWFVPLALISIGGGAIGARQLVPQAA